LIQKNGNSKQIHISFNPDIFNLFIKDNLKEFDIKLNYIRTDFTLDWIADRITMEIMKKKNIPYDHTEYRKIYDEIWFRNSSYELL